MYRHGKLLRESKALVHRLVQLVVEEDPAEACLGRVVYNRIRCRVEGSGFLVYGLWFMVWGLWFMVYGLGFMVYG